MTSLKTKPGKAVANNWPRVEKGSHLTVYTYEDGSTKLEWDDAALQRDVEAAILSVTGEENGKTRKTRKSK
jgi:hypothetical protein